MSFNENNLNHDLNERRPSSNSIITAWQIESTLNNMNQFIKFIEQFQSQREQLDKILPFIQRVKKNQDEKEFFRKQLIELGKILPPFQIYQKQQSSIKSQKQQKNFKQMHYSLLFNLTKNINNSNLQNKSKVSQLKRKIQDITTNRRKDRIDKRERLLSKLDNDIKIKMNSMQTKIASQNTLPKKQQFYTVYNSFIELYVNQKFSSINYINQLKQIDSSDQSQIHQSKLTQQRCSQENIVEIVDINKDCLKKDLVKKFNELGQIKCKLLSLQDKKRKITVKNLLMNNVSNKIQVLTNNFETLSASRRFKLIQSQYNKTAQSAKQEERTVKTKDKDQNELFGLIFSIFSNNKRKDEQKIIQKQYLSIKNQQRQIKQRSNEMINSRKMIQSQLQEIDDKEIKLKIAEIHSQILELRELIKIVINQNTFDQLLDSMMQLKLVNEQLKSYIEQLMRLVLVMKGQRQIKQLSSLNLSFLKENQQVKFFFHFIKDKLVTRQQLIKNLFDRIGYSVSVAKKYINIRLGEIQQQFSNFIDLNHSKDKKLKSIQTLHSKTQFILINSAFESLSSEINQITEKRLIPLEKIFENQFKKYIKDFTNGMQNSYRQNQLNQQILSMSNQSSLFKSGQLQWILSFQIRNIEKILLQVEIKENIIRKRFQDKNLNYFNENELNSNNFKSQCIQQLFNFYSQLCRKVLDVFYET